MYCPGCKPELGLAAPNPAWAWQKFAVNMSGVGTPSLSVQPQTGGRCCVTGSGLAAQSCAQAIRGQCPGESGNDCIECVEKHAAALSGAWPHSFVNMLILSTFTFCQHRPCLKTRGRCATC